MELVDLNRSLHPFFGDTKNDQHICSVARWARLDMLSFIRVTWVTRESQQAPRIEEAFLWPSYQIC